MAANKRMARIAELRPRSTPGASVMQERDSWRLTIPAGAAGTYRLAQLDDYSRVPRRGLPHYPPYAFHVRARVSAEGLPGTWGFGLWNDPFGLSLGFGGTPGQLPALPETAWFFHASPPNYLSLRDDLPARGFFAGTFHSPRMPTPLLAPGLLALPLLAIRPVARMLRRLAGRMVKQSAAAIDTDVTAWHEYAIDWKNDKTVFTMDGLISLETPLSPRPPLGLVLWIDNQYAAWTPQGKLGYGTLANPEAWLELSF
jgi:hypothetical protein